MTRREFDPEKIQNPVRVGFTDWYDSQRELDLARKREDYWDDFAERLARDAHENFMPNRWGFWWLRKFKKFVLYNNNPYKLDELARDLELVKIREDIEAAGMREWGFGLWPRRDDKSAEMEHKLAGEYMRALHAEARNRGLDVGECPFGSDGSDRWWGYTYAMVIEGKARDYEVVVAIQDAAFMSGLRKEGT